MQLLSKIYHQHALHELLLNRVETYATWYFVNVLKKNFNEYLKYEFNEIGIGKSLFRHNRPYKNNISENVPLARKKHWILEEQ